MIPPYTQCPDCEAVTGTVQLCNKHKRDAEIARLKAEVEEKNNVMHRAVEDADSLRKEVERQNRKLKEYYAEAQLSGNGKIICDLRSRLERAEKERAGVMSTNRTLFDNCNKERRRAEKAEERIRELEEVRDGAVANLLEMKERLESANRLLSDAIIERITAMKKAGDAMYNLIFGTNIAGATEAVVEWKKETEGL